MSQVVYYGGLFAISFLMTIFYAYRWHKQFNVDMTVFFVLMPVVNLAYFIMYSAHDLAVSKALLIFVYVGACFLPWFTTMCELDLCKIRVERAFSLITFSFCSLVLLCDIVLRDTNLLYSSLTLERVGSAWVLNKVYGSFQIVHYIFVLIFLVVDIGILVYSLKKKKEVSRIVLLLLALPVIITILGYLAGMPLVHKGYELTLFTYLIGQVVYLLIVRRMAYYNISEMVMESMVLAGKVGFITLDLKGRYLGCNETAKAILPELGQMTVDRSLEQARILDWLTQFKKDNSKNRFLYTPETDPEKIYMVRLDDLYYGKKRCGYQIFVEDDTANQKYIRLLDHYNEELQKDVAAKTRHIETMNDRYILGIASMVESRDNSTGSHIRRTSECVRMITVEMQKDQSLQLPDSFYRSLIKAAPMHDLGKIAVDDAILRKPGRYTPEEYEVMKTHAAEGAKIVYNILKDTDDDYFRCIAENVAHYHHERMDGSGYPEGLKGDDIPLEARIMAIADVYDALVSKRVYKERFSFEKANEIILDGMGTQFDPKLRKYYEAARPNLEAYYSEDV